MKQTNNDTEFLKEINSEIGMLTGQAAPLPDPPSVSRRGKREAEGDKIQINNKALTWIIILSLLVVLICGSVGAYFIMRYVGHRTLDNHIALENVEVTGPDGATISDDGDIIYWNGKTYKKRDSVINVLCMGIDQDNSGITEGDVVEYGSAGQADTVFLAALDLDTGSLTLLNVSRDTMTDVDVYNADGEYVDTQEMQLCLAYAYGDAREASCLNMATAVSRLMYGVPIDVYASLDLPGVSVINDAVGGVQVKVREDLTSYDPSLVEGATVTLHGSLAEIYVRSRSHADADANSRRMARQRQYVAAFLRKAFSQIRTDFSVAMTLYQAVRAYSNTSLTLPQILYLVSAAQNTDIVEQDIITISGEAVMGDEYAEFYVDEDMLFQTIIDTYYQEVS